MKKIRYTKAGRLTAESRRHVLSEIRSAKSRAEYIRTTGVYPFGPSIKHPWLLIRHPEIVDLIHHPATRLLSAPLVTLPLGSAEEHLGRRAAYGMSHPNKKNFTSPEPAIQKADYVYREEAFEYRGHYKGWHGSNGYVTVRAFAAVTPGMLSAVIRDKTFNLQAPRGYRWETDSVGAKLVRLVDGVDYHVSTDDVAAGIAHCRKQVLYKASVAKKARAEQRRVKKILKQAGDLMVRFADARAAGNCDPGIRAYCRKHNLDPARAYRADKLPEPNRIEVAATVLKAQKRYLEDMRRGYCIVTP